MDCSSSLYMCFPCCQLFSSLEDVLSHQQTCHSDDTKEEAAQAAPSDDLDEVLFNNVVSSPSQVILNGDVQDNQRQTGSCSDPLIHYQCGDCGSLFDSLAQWQHHRKLGLCAEPAIHIKDMGREGGAGEGEEGQREVHVESKMQGSGAHGKVLERGMEADLGTAEVEITALSCILEEEPVNSQTITEEQKLKTNETEMVSAVTPAVTSQNFLCMYCGNGFSSESALVAHRKTRHGLEEAVHCCPVCKETFMSTTLFLYHRRQHRERQAQELEPNKTAKIPLTASSGEEKRSDSNLKGWSKKAKGKANRFGRRAGPILWQVWGSNTHTSYTWVYFAVFSVGIPVVVILSHLDCILDKCMNSQQNECYTGNLHLFHIINSFLIPLRPSHASELPFSCLICGKFFLCRKELQLHLFTHQGFLPCPRCFVQFSDQAVLDVHMHSCPKKVKQTVRRGRGRNVELLICDLCGHCCMTQDGLDLHRLSHSGQTPLRCPLLPCRRRFITSSALEDHILTHSQTPPDLTAQDFAPKPRPFHCERCSKSFTTASSLSVHLRIHTGERPYQCTQCGKRFRQIPHLRDHERLHSGVRPFSCEVCGKSFVLAARLAEHARTHSGEKPYTCPLCTRTFRSLSNLGKHRKTHSKSPAHKEVSSTEEGETAVQTILLVQAQPSILQGADQPHLCQLSPPTMTVTSTASSPLVLLHPTTSLSKVQEEQVIPIIQHAIDVIVEETV
uniref:Zinc finger protein 846-like n=1 Tax=Scleropages formosus TaxID=113540 RepID=A0A8D0CE67_SCLFO